MISTLHQPELQERTLRLYGELLSRRSDWSGHLALAAFEGAASCGLAAAASLAGAASLTVDSDADAMKTQFRDGAFDFLVNTLDEALRALKNELRRGRPIAIGLIASSQTVLQEAGERGLAVRFLLSVASEPSALERALLDRDGAVTVANSDREPSNELATWLERHHWTPELVERIAKAEDFEKGDPRAIWVRGLVTYQRSATKSHRWLWLSATEHIAWDG